jgi:hypothetical protein
MLKETCLVDHFKDGRCISSHYIMNNHSSCQALDLSLQMAWYEIRQFMATPTFRFVNVMHHLERILRIEITQDFCSPES